MPRPRSGCHRRPVFVGGDPVRIELEGGFRLGIEGEAVWLRILKAIEELLSEELPGDAKVH